MRVEPAHRDPRVLDAEPIAQSVGHQVDRLKNATDGEGVAEIEQRLVNARQSDAQFTADEHHGEALGLEGIPQLLGVAGVAVPGQVPALFADGGGDNGLDHLVAR